MSKILFYFIVVLLSLSACGIGPKMADKANESRQKIDLNDTIALNIAARRAFITGYEFQLKNKFSDAILEYFEVLEYDKSPFVYTSIAKCYKELKKYDKSLRYIALSLELDPENTITLELFSEILLLQGDFEGAAEVYERLYAINKDIDKLYMLAQIYEYFDMDKAAQKYLEIPNFANNEFIIKKLYRFFYDKGSKLRYLEMSKRLVEINPQSKVHNSNYLDDLINNNQLDNAINHLSVINQNFENTELFYFYQKVGNHIMNTKSAEYYNVFAGKIDSRFDENWKLLFMAGYMSSLSKNFELSYDFYVRTLSNEDCHSDVLLETMMDFARNDQFELLIKYTDTLNTLGFDNLYINTFRGQAYLLLKKDLMAYKEFEKIFKIEPNNVDNLLQLAIVSDKLGKIDDSDRFYTKLLELVPNHPLANNNFAYSLTLRGIDLEKCLMMAKTALYYEPENEHYLDTYAWVLYHLDRADEALTYLLKALEKDKENPELYEHLGDVYRKLNKNESALNAYESGLKLDPNRTTLIERIDILKGR